MKRLTKGVLSALLALAFLSRGAAALCPPKAMEHGCCDKSAPAAPQTPCAEMACCQVVPPASPAVVPAADNVALLTPAPAFVVPASTSLALCSPTDSVPPGPPIQSHSGLSPPALLG